jgi:glycosyltransferase involved in cell wall biosynthesis
MNIAFINPEYPSLSGHDQGGIATYTYCMALACAELGHRVHILVKNGIVQKQIHRSVIFHEFGPIPLRSPFRRLKKIINGDILWEREYGLGVRQLILSIHKNEPLDIIEAPEYNGLAGELQPPLPCPVIVHFHTPTVIVDQYNAEKINWRRKQWYSFEQRACLNAAAYRCPSRALAMEITKRYGIAQSRIAIIQHPFDTALFDAIEKKRKEDHFDILFVGRLERRKGAEFLLMNLQRILSLDPRLRFTFAGEYSVGDMDQYRCAIERSLSENDRKRVWFLGPIKREKLPVLYCRSDLLCFPSLFENAPYTILEAMAAKLPVIGANTGGIPELIHHEENGLLFNPESPEELLDSIRTVIAHPDKAKAFANSAYATMKKDFKPDVIARLVIEFYSSVMASFNKK